MTLNRVLPKYLTKIVLYIVSLFLASCGQGAPVGVEGSPALTVKFDMSGLTQFFAPYCEELLAAQGFQNPAPEQVQTCASVMAADFFAQTQGQPAMPVGNTP